jgi:hypothetical protein
MQEFFKKFSVAYLAGALGGLAATLLLWAIGHWSLLAAPVLAALVNSLAAEHWAAPVLRGSLWGLCMVPLALVLRVKALAFGLILSLIPSAYSLLVVYPRQHHGVTPFAHDVHWALLILLLNAVWGLAAGAIYRSLYKA